ncbi:hypothetical protein CHLRE_06g299350v5 [Chlamydomonas reinhardtii]|uniref:Transmembrane protein 45B n=1 Tax=Chlamydomonas reinhardtii TaxID=3055 RepID=A0A2K3DQU0_CHLRE|nr:uncharacterized protein CHLRE_06g299350v5 [Chlamydomonas reinhardtii]PNW82913.1 hypothetical protein CHLRE_06g299350v5 [Chlamydomonas reinhardtii]
MTDHTDEGMGGSGMSPAPSGGSMAGGMAMGGMMDCNGGSIPDRQGNFQGHAFPGTIFIIWGLHWFISASWRYLCSTRTGRAYRSRTFEGLLPMIPQLNGFNRYPVEPVLKAIGGLLLFILQITYGSYKFLYCPDGARQGRIVTQHLNSWSHASMNLGFSLSGIVELIGLHIKLPEGTHQVILSGAFFIEAMLFSLHEKNGHLDQTDHWLLAQCCWAGAIFSALEAAWPEAFLLTAGRAGSMLLQGAWFWQSGFVLFGGSLVWNDLFMGREDEAPAMFMPLVFAYHMLVLQALMLLVYMVVELVYRRQYPGTHNAVQEPEHAPSNGGYETSRLLTDEDEAHGLKSIPLGNLRHEVRRV